MELRISPTQIKLWSECREKHRIQYLLEKEPVQWSIHYAFGSVIHRIAEGYWAGKEYLQTFHMALEEASLYDVRKIDAKDQVKWVGLQEAIAPITTLYYGYHGDKAKTEPALMNEKVVEWNWGNHAGMDVVCNGIIDRLSNRRVLIDTKTASAVGKDWKTDLKKRLLREPQMGFYLAYLEEAGITPSGIEYEIIVKPYRGSEPRIETIDVDKEVVKFQPIFRQQLDWTIREMCQFYASCKDAAPWPMSNTACVSMWGECDFLSVCSGKADVNDRTLYQIKEKREEVTA
jgi:hypothetical protein